MCTSCQDFWLNFEFFFAPKVVALPTYYQCALIAYAPHSEWV